MYTPSTKANQANLSSIRRKVRPGLHGPTPSQLMILLWARPQIHSTRAPITAITTNNKEKEPKTNEGDTSKSAKTEKTANDVNASQDKPTKDSKDKQRKGKPATKNNRDNSERIWEDRNKLKRNTEDSRNRLLSRDIGKRSKHCRTGIVDYFIDME